MKRLFGFDFIRLIILNCKKITTTTNTTAVTTTTSKLLPELLLLLVPLLLLIIINAKATSGSSSTTNSTSKTPTFPLMYFCVTQCDSHNYVYNVAQYAHNANLFWKHMQFP